MKIKLNAELIFIWMVSHLNSFETEAQENSEMAYFFKILSRKQYRTYSWLLKTGSLDNAIREFSLA